MTYLFFMGLTLFFFSGCGKEYKFPVVKEAPILFKATVSKQNPDLNEEVDFTLSLEYDQSLGDLEIPQAGFAIQGLRVQEEEDHPPVQAGSRISLSKTYHLVCDLKGAFVLPQVVLKYTHKGVKKELKTSRIFINVAMPDQPAEGEMEDILDIEGLEEMKFERDYRGYYVLLFLFFLLITGYFAYKKSTQEILEEIPLKSYEWAILELKRYDWDTLIESSDSREFYLALGAIARGLLKRELKVNAEEWTTQELLPFLAKQDFPVDILQSLEGLFSHAELSIFADISTKEPLRRAEYEGLLSCVKLCEERDEYSEPEDMEVFEEVTE